MEASNPFVWLVDLAIAASRPAIVEPALLLGMSRAGPRTQLDRDVIEGDVLRLTQSVGGEVDAALGAAGDVVESDVAGDPGVFRLCPRRDRKVDGLASPPPCARRPSATYERRIWIADRTHTGDPTLWSL